MAEYVLYNAPQSTCSQRVRFVLHAKGLAFLPHFQTTDRRILTEKYPHLATLREQP